MPPESSTEEQVSPGAAGAVQDAKAAPSTADSTPAASAADRADGNGAESSTAQDGKPRSMLAAVTAAAVKPGADKASASAEGDPEPTAKQPAAQGAQPEGDGELGPLTDEEFHKYGPKTRQRIRKFLDNEKKLKDQVAELQPDAENFRRVQSFVHDAGLARDEVNELLAVGAALKADPFKALEMIEPHYKRLLQLTGRVLPDDLRQQVEQGYMPETAARETAQLRAKERILTATNDERTRRADQQRQQMQASADAAATAVSEWDNKWRASDPDYQTKQPLVQDEIELAMSRAQREGKLPKTPAEAVAMVEQARARVEEKLKRLRPSTRTEIRPTPAGGSAPATAPKARSMAEALARAVA